MMIRVAMPVADGSFSPHFGRCDGFYVFDVLNGRIDRPRRLPRPKPSCESLPDWLNELGVGVVIVGGAGPVAIHHMEQRGIRVVKGVSGDRPERLASAYLAGELADAENPCAPSEHRVRHCRPRPQRKTHQPAS